MVASVQSKLAVWRSRFKGSSNYKKSLLEGLVCGAIIFGLLFGWMYYRAEDTAHKLQDSIPSKSTTIEMPAENKPALTAQTGPSPIQDGLNGTKNINALVAAPIEGLTENFEGKYLPMSRFEDELSPFEAYKKPFVVVAGRPMISIVIVDYGISDTFSQSILDNLSPEISLVLNSYSTEPAKWASAARAYGHEFWLSLPMQTQEFGSDDTGPESILMNTSIAENQKRLFNVMGAAVGYVGLVSQKGHIFTKEDIDVSPIMKQVFGRGLGFAESNPDVPAYGLAMAMEFGYPYVQNNLWIDDDLRPAAIDRKLRELELQASKNGKAIAFVRPYPVAVKKVAEWIAGAPDKGILVAPLSAMAQ